MKLRALVVTVVLLATLSAVVFQARRPAASVAADPRVGQPLADPAAIGPAAGLRITGDGKSVLLTRNPDGSWRDAGYFGLPADFPKLTGFVNDLTAARIQRFVTSNPERLGRLDLGGARVEFLDAAGQALWSIGVGKETGAGGRFIRFGQENRAYLANLSAPIDADPKDWADAQLLNLRPDDVARVEISFDQGGPVTVQRAKKDAAWTSAQAPAGEKVDAEKISGVIAALGALRFSDTGDLGDPAAAAARRHERVVKFTGFDGTVSVVALGQKAAPPPAKPKADETPAAPEPVYARVSSSDPKSPVNGWMARRSFQVDEYALASLPPKPGELFQR